MPPYNVINRNSMQAGQVEDIGQVLANFDAIAAILNGQIDNSNISAVANIGVSKLAAGTPGQVIADLAAGVGWAGGIAQIAGSVLGAPAVNMDYTALDQSFKHLLVVGQTRGQGGAAAQFVSTRFNNDTGLNYRSSGIGFDQSSITVGRQNDVSQDPQLGGFAFFVMDYTSAVLRKTLVGIQGGYVVTDGGVGGSVTAGRWVGTAAINRVTILPLANNLDTGSRVSIYGVG